MAYSDTDRCDIITQVLDELNERYVWGGSIEIDLDIPVYSDTSNLILNLNNFELFNYLLTFNQYNSDKLINYLHSVICEETSTEFPTFFRTKPIIYYKFDETFHVLEMNLKAINYKIQK